MFIVNEIAYIYVNEKKDVKSHLNSLNSLGGVSILLHARYLKLNARYLKLKYMSCNLLLPTSN